MAALILLLALAGIFAALLAGARKQATHEPYPYALLGAAVLFGLLVTLSTEALSIGRALSFSSLLVFWSTVAGLSWLIVRRLAPSSTADTHVQRLQVTATEETVLLLLALISATTLIIALVAPPNTPDSLVYHMPRVMHWQHNGSVAFYPTPILRQLHMPPWAEYAILHCQILAGSDRLANLVQWTAMLGCVLAVFQITGQLSGGRNSRLFSAVFAATIPMGILQATSTQNDAVCAFWLLTAIYFGLHLLRTPRINRLSVLFFGGAVGLAMLTKATAYLYVFPFICWISAAALLRYGRKALIPLVAAGSLALMTNLPQYARNQSLFGTPLGTGNHGAKEIAVESYANQTHSPQAVLSNVMRNAGLHLVTPSPFVNGWIERGIRYGHNVLGIAINDIRTTWLGTHYQTKPLSTSEDEAANPLHFILLLVATGLVIRRAIRRQQRTRIIYATMVAGGAFLFCLLLRWQPWHSRLHLPIFLAGAPIVGIMLAGNTRITQMVTAVLLLGGIPYLVCNQTRPLCGSRSVLTTARSDLVMRGKPAHRPSWQKAVAKLADETQGDVWLMMDGERLEYIIWALAAMRDRDDLNFRHAAVPNLSSRLDTPLKVQPKYALELARTNAPPDAITLSGHRYCPTWSAEDAERQRWTVLYRLNM